MMMGITARSGRPALSTTWARSVPAIIVTRKAAILEVQFSLPALALHLPFTPMVVAVEIKLQQTLVVC
jgi:hypothetical protein